MKYFLPANICFLVFAAAGLSLFLHGYQFAEEYPWLFLGMGTISLVVITAAVLVYQDFEIKHMRRILKKNGFWTDEIIRKKDLKE